MNGRQPVCTHVLVLEIAREWLSRCTKRGMIARVWEIWMIESQPGLPKSKTTTHTRIYGKHKSCNWFTTTVCSGGCLIGIWFRQWLKNIRDEKADNTSSAELCLIRLNLHRLSRKEPVGHRGCKSRGYRNHPSAWASCISTALTQHNLRIIFTLNLAA